MTASPDASVIDAAVVHHPAAVGLHEGVHARSHLLQVRRPSSQVMAPVSPTARGATRVAGITSADHWHPRSAAFRPRARRCLTPSVPATARAAHRPSAGRLISCSPRSRRSRRSRPTSTCPGFPAMGDDLGASASAVQLTLTTFLVGLAVGQLVMGPLSDRYGRRPPLVASTAVCVVAGVVCALAPTLAVLAAARLVQGFAGRRRHGDRPRGDRRPGHRPGGGQGLHADAHRRRGRAGAGAAGRRPARRAGRLARHALGGRRALRGHARRRAASCSARPTRRRRAPPRARRTPTALRAVARTRGYWPPVAVLALSFAVMMAYISASPFVYQNVVGLSAVGYGDRVRRQRGRADRGRAGSPAGWSSASSRAGSCGPRSRSSSPPRSTFVVLAVVDAPTWLLPVPIFVAVASNGA